MAKQELVSVIIPVCNRPELVERAVRSVFAQSCDNWELIVINDGSTDHTSEVLDSLAKEAQGRMRVVNQENRGVSAARNTGMALAQADLIALLDSDDEWMSRKLELHVPFLRENGFEICQTQEIWMRGGKRVNPMRKHAKPSGRFFIQALEMCLVSPSCVMFSQKFLGDVGNFDESLPACEDYDLWLRALTGFDIGLLEHALTIRHGGRPDQLSARYTGLDLYRIRAMAKLLDPERPLPVPLTPEHKEMVLRVMLAKAEVYVAGCLKRGRVEEAQRVQALVDAAKKSAQTRT
ncbi:MAG: glycosyltransferase family 2 protein [Desulfovibrio sp.]|nr:MAG: glycosyltransferase family 2 protein [Desulfovibrio sp.]